MREFDALYHAVAAGHFEIVKFMHLKTRILCNNSAIIAIMTTAAKMS